MEKLRELRKKRNFTQDFIAEEIGVSRPAYARYESGMREPDIKTLEKIADFYDVSVDYLIGRTDDPMKKMRPTIEESALAIEKALIEGGHIQPGEDLTKVQADALLEFILRNRDFIFARADELRKSGEAADIIRRYTAE